MSKPQHPQEQQSKPLQAHEIVPVSPSVAITLTQCFANAVQRQGLANAKNMVESGTPLSKINPKILATGFTSRLLYQGLAMAPSMLIREHVDKNVPTFVVSAVTTAAETAIGTPLEVRGAEKTLKTLGYDISGRRMDVAHRAMYPFFARNYLSWMVLNNPSEDLGTKLGWGGAAGLFSAFPDTIGNFLMKQEAGLEIGEAFKKAFKDSRNIPVADFAKAATLRGLAGAGTAVIFSPQFQKELVRVFDPLVQQAEAMLKTAAATPSTQVEQASAKNAKAVKDPKSLNR